ncbi:MAG TPA: hypothetical protein VES58_02510, partial [Syntrophobacteria bacterium]|nr:hypothetical protein [Syntrophobacteria bacterium]
MAGNRERGIELLAIIVSRPKFDRNWPSRRQIPRLTRGNFMALDLEKLVLRHCEIPPMPQVAAKAV